MDWFHEVLLLFRQTSFLTKIEVIYSLFVFLLISTMSAMQISVSPKGQLIETARRQPLFIEDDLRIDLTHFYIPLHYQDTLEHLLIPHGTIVDRVEKLAYDISQDYLGETIHLLVVLKGRIFVYYEIELF